MSQPPGSGPTQPNDPNPASGEASSTPATHSDDDDVAPSDLAAVVADSLARLPELPVEEHPQVYEDVHHRLGDTLSGIDDV